MSTLDAGVPAYGVPIEHAVRVRATPERAFDAIATADGLDGWFTDGAEVGRASGEPAVFRWADWGPEGVTAADRGTIVTYDRPHRFEFAWNADLAGGPTTVRLDFEPAAGGTVVRLHERGYPDTEAGRSRLVECAAGWGEALALLRSYLEHGIAY